MNNLCIIQARTGSRRLPGKVLKKLSNLTLLEWVIKRVKKSKKIDKIVLATSNLKADIQLKIFAKKNKIFFFSGSNKDVLKRFYDVALLYKPKIIIRVCADNPFIDHNLLDILIKKFNHKKFDYSFNHQTMLSNYYADGFGGEIFTYNLLKKINKEADKTKHREHVTLYVWENIKKFKIQLIKSYKNISFPELRFDINTKKDFDNLKHFIKIKKITIKTSAQRIVSFYKNYIKNKINDT